MKRNRGKEKECLIQELRNAKMYGFVNKLADHLVDDLGIIVPPCKVGSTVYWADKSIPKKKQLLTGKVFAIGVDENDIMWISVKYTNGLKFYHTSTDFEHCLFLNKKDAENYLNKDE